jgi:enamine deaminase RidA (YjgF/YER057c/UK114 family)
MPGKIEARLTELGIELPESQPPWADYVSYVVSNDFVYLSGQLPKLGDEEYLGKLGADLTVEHGAASITHFGNQYVASSQRSVRWRS